MMETQRQRMRRRISERGIRFNLDTPQPVRKPTRKHPIYKIAVQHPIKHKNRKQRRLMGMHKGLPDLFTTGSVHIANCQQRVYIGFYRHNQLVNVQAIPAHQFKHIKQGVIITRRDYLRFLRDKQEPQNISLQAVA